MEWYTLSILVFLFLCHFCRQNKKFFFYGFATFLEDFEYIFYVLSHQTHSKIATEITALSKARVVWRESNAM